MQKTRKYILFLFSAVIIYALLYIPAYYIPIHSDDYLYFLQGLSFKAHFQHYMNWSGRFITDYTSSLLLNLFSRHVYMAINSLAFLIVLINITSISSLVISERLIDKNSYIVLWITFFLYWLCNPNLEQTSFWVVGSANYLWTILWGSSFLLYLFYLIKRDKHNYDGVKITNLLVLAVLGIFAGLSNESTGVSIVFLSFILFFSYRKKFVLLGFLSSLIGFLVLLLAPGNYMRLKHNAFFYWNNISFSQKMITHFFERIPSELSGFWFAFLIINILLLFMFLSFDKTSFNFNNFRFVTVFFSISLFSVIVFCVSPYVPPRALNTFNFFIVLTVATLLNVVLAKDNKRKTYLFGFLFICCLPYFILSWSRFTYAVKQTSVQAEIREFIIQKAVNDNVKEVKIPDWYFTKLVKSSDKFDLFRSDAMPQYYGIDKIIWTPVNFNYAIVKNQKPLISNKKLSNGVILNLYQTKNWLFDEPSLIFEFNVPKLMLSAEGASHIFCHVYLNGEKKFINADKRIIDLTEIGDRCYLVIRFRDIKIKSMNSIERMHFGIYDLKSEKRFSSDQINL